jgi:transcriptional regulator with XRE-family HTH domain
MVGRVLRALREERELTQEKLAYAAGVDRTFVGMVERNERHVTINTVGFLLDGLGVTWEDFGARLDKSLKARKRG